MRLEEAVRRFAARTPHALAVAGPDGRLTYGELDRLGDQIGHALISCGVGVGDRVAIWLEKSTVAVACMQAVLRCGAAYVPIDPLSPVAHGRRIFDDCSVRVLITTQSRAARVQTGADRQVQCLCIDGSWNGGSWQEVLRLSAATLSSRAGGTDDLAYILYTSGSTGQPKGVCISHGNALAFTRWAEKSLGASAEDRFANHAPFHFDLSVLDLYVAFQVGASVHLIPDSWSFAADLLVDFLIDERLTLWYSVPSVLILMMEHGAWLERSGGSLRALLFAGETFPIKYVKRLRERWPGLRLLNFYGPTETNVCTWYEVDALDPARTTPVPIGRACSGDRVWARCEDGSVASPGEEGELIVEGSSVMLGYWGDEPQGKKPYATGDMVRMLGGNVFEFAGRRDHRVKVRGHRVELGEIESVLLQHDAVQEATVVVSGSGLDARLIACISCRDPARRPSLIGLKQYLAQRVPRYMIIDGIRYLERLPKSRTGKVDRHELARWVPAS